MIFDRINIDKTLSCHALFNKPPEELTETEDKQYTLISQRISVHALHPYGPNLYCLKSPFNFVSKETKPSRTFLTIYPNGQAVVLTHFPVDGNKHHFTDHQPHIDAGLKQIREEELEALKARPRPAPEQEDLAPDQEHQVQERLEKLQTEVDGFEFDNTNSKVEKLCELYTRSLQLQSQLLTDDHHQHHEKVSTELLSHFTTLLSSEYLKTSFLKVNGKTYLTIQRVNCKKFPILIEDDHFLPTLFEHAQEQFQKGKLKVRAMGRFVLTSCTANPDRMLEAYLNLLRLPTFSTTDIDNEWLNQFCAECLDSIDSGHLESSFFFELLGAFTRHNQLSCLNKENTDRCIHRGLQEKESCSVLLNTGWNHLKQALPRLSKQTLSALLRKLSVQESGSVKIFELLEEIGEVHWDVFMEVIGGLQKIPTPVLTKLRAIFDGKQKEYAPERNTFYDHLLLKHEAWAKNHEIWNAPLAAIHKHREELAKAQEEEQLVKRQQTKKKGKKQQSSTLTLQEIISALKGFLKPGNNQIASPQNQLKLLFKYMRLNRQLGFKSIHEKLTNQEFTELLRLSMTYHFPLFNELITSYRSMVTAIMTADALSAFRDTLITLAEQCLRLQTPLALERLLQLGLQANQTLPNGLTLLRALLTQSKAFESRILPFVKTLLDHGANPDSFFDGTTSVHVAVILNWNNVLALLLRYGANCNKSDFLMREVKIFPRDIAATQADLAASEILRKHNAVYSFGPALFQFKIVPSNNPPANSKPGTVTTSVLLKNKIPKHLKKPDEIFNKVMKILGGFFDDNPPKGEEIVKVDQQVMQYLTQLSKFPIHFMNSTIHKGAKFLHLLAMPGTPEEIEYVLRNFNDLLLDVKCVEGNIYGDFVIGATALDMAVNGGRIENAKVLLAHGSSVDSQEKENDSYSLHQKNILRAMSTNRLSEMKRFIKLFERYCICGFDPNSVARVSPKESRSSNKLSNWASDRGETSYEMAVTGYEGSDSRKKELVNDKRRVLRRLIELGADKDFQKDKLTLLRIVILSLQLNGELPSQSFKMQLKMAVDLCIDSVIRVDLKKPCYDPETLFSFENIEGGSGEHIKKATIYKPTGIDLKHLEQLKRLIRLLRNKNFRTVVKTDSSSLNFPDQKQKTLNALCQAIWDDDLDEFKKHLDAYEGDKDNLLSTPCFQDKSTLLHLVFLLRREELILEMLNYTSSATHTNADGETTHDYYELSTLGLALADPTYLPVIAKKLNSLDGEPEANLDEAPS